MSRPALATTAAPPPLAVPAWAVPRGPVDDAAEAAFLAGAALASLDSLVRSEPAWAGGWRQRLALKSAASACRLVGRGEDEAALRDAWHLRKGNDDPGPAGSILAAFRQLASRPTTIDVGGVAWVAERFGLRWEDAFADIPDAFDEVVRTGLAAPFAAAATMRHVLDAAPAAEPLAWWLADLALAAKLRWARPVRLLMAQALSPAFRAADGRGKRLKPGEENFERALCLALVQAAAEAGRLAVDMSRRAERLQTVAPKLRAKGAADAIARLLDDDAVPGTFSTRNLSRFAAHRLFERLSAFEAVRELSGRPAFKLFGL